MKNAPTTCWNLSTRFKGSTTAGKLPVRKGTIVAGVLARLLEDAKPLTVWDAVDAFRTTRLNNAIRTLKKKYGWPIELVEFPTYMPDGRIVWVKGYKLPQAAIDHAFRKTNVATWINMVKVAQARQRSINEAKAAALNAYRLGIDPPYFQKCVFFASQAVEGQ